MHIGDKARVLHKKIDYKKVKLLYNKNISNLKKKHNLIDAYPYFLNAAKDKRLYYFLDATLNNYGNQVIFDIFQNYCEKKKCYN